MGAPSFLPHGCSQPEASVGLPPPRPIPVTTQNGVFGKPLKESLKYASVQISTANANGELYVWGYIPVVVAKSCVPFTLTFAIISVNARQLRNSSGLYLKEQGAFHPRHVHAHTQTSANSLPCFDLVSDSPIPRVAQHSNRDRRHVSNKW